MIFLDTSALIYAFEADSPYRQWALDLIVEAVSGDGAILNPIVIAELCVGDPEADSVPDRIRSRGVEILSLPAACAPVCARAFAHYRARRQRHSGRSLAAVPLPDFFIGAHSQVIGPAWLPRIRDATGPTFRLSISWNRKHERHGWNPALPRKRGKGWNRVVGDAGFEPATPAV